MFLKFVQFQLLPTSQVLHANSYLHTLSDQQDTAHNKEYRALYLLDWCPFAAIASSRCLSRLQLFCCSLWERQQVGAAAGTAASTGTSPKLKQPCCISRDGSWMYADCQLTTCASSAAASQLFRTCK